MNFKKEKRLLQILNIVEVILSLSLIIIFTIIFRLDLSNTRYLFLIGDIYAIYSLYNTIQNMEIKNKKRQRVIKNSKSKIEAKYLKKLSA